VGSGKGSPRGPAGVRAGRFLLLEYKRAGGLCKENVGPDGQWLASASEDGTVRIWEGERHQQVALLNHANEMYAVASRPRDHEELDLGAPKGTVSAGEVIE
jgi:WD40 repeat protein